MVPRHRGGPGHDEHLGASPETPIAAPDPGSPPAASAPAPSAPAPPDGVEATRAADPFAVPGGPDPTIRPSDPFAGPVDATATAALRDPFASPPTDDPLAPPPLPPDPFSSPLPAPVASPTLDVSSDVRAAVDAPASDPSSNGSGILDDPFAPPPLLDGPDTPVGDDRADLGISVLDAIVVDDPLADAHPSPDPARLDPAPVALPDVPPIAWSADGAQEAAAPTLGDTTPRFERAGAHWQIGGIFPATAMADDGTLALRRADARWALTDLRAPADCVIETTVDFRSGSGFGIMFGASTDDGERITGYSFDVDPVAGGGSYLVRFWESSRQHWRPLAQAPVTDPAVLTGRHVLELTLRADQLSARVDAEPVLDITGLSRCTIELGKEPSRGDRVGIQAWSTTEVTVESFRVASL